MLILDTPHDLAAAQHQLKSVATAAYDLLLALGHINNEAPCTGPALLQMLEEQTQMIRGTLASDNVPPSPAG